MSETSLTDPAQTPLTEKIAGEALGTGLRQTVQFPRTGSLLHAILARPWIDPVCLWAFKRVLPASRAWAAAGASSTSLEGFARQLGLFGLPPRLAQQAQRHAPAAPALQGGADALVRDGVRGRGRRPRRRPSANGARPRRPTWPTASATCQFAKKYRVSAVRYRTPKPDFAIEALSQVLTDPDALFQVPETLPAIERSKSVDHGDVIEYWLRFESDGVGDDPADTCYAHVYEPKQHPKSLPSFFFAHGLAMETEMMVDGPRSFLNMARVGMRIVLPDGPGHNRRCKTGYYGGESFLTEPPISGIQHFVRAAREYAAMIAWCRAQGPGKISLGGVSLGALTAQVAASRWRYWPAECKPDALFLMTSTARVSALPLESSLGQMADLDNEVRRHGWRAEHFEALESITDATAEPPIDPANIVLMVGKRDDVTPAAGGHQLAGQWRIPKDNLFVRDRGHFSAAIGLGVDPSPYARMFDILSR